MMRRSLLAFTLLLATPAAAQEWVAGVEATAGATYSYLTHYTRSGDIIVWQTVSLLTYRTREGVGETRVSSPGIASGLMRRWTTHERSFGIGAGYEVRWTERRLPNAPPTTENEQGLIVEGDFLQRFSARTSGRLAGRWSGANNWRAASAEISQQITGRLRAGPQVIWQGNEDITVLSAGAFVEIPLGRSGFQIRGGQARIEHRDGTTETQPYLSAGIVVPF